MKDHDAFEQVLATVAELLTAEGMTEAARFVRSTRAQAEETGFDNWNGGISLWTVSFGIEPLGYAKLGERRMELEQQISARLDVVLSPSTEDRYFVKIVPKIAIRPNWRQLAEDLSEATRRNIVDALKIEGIIWHGRLDEVEFLARTFELTSLPSYDSRYKDAAQDIWQHCINNPGDWDSDWIYTDARFNLFGGPSETFLRFLCEIVHPVVRPDREEAVMLVSHFNDQLRAESWEIFEQEKIAGRPRFSYRNLSASNRSVTRARAVADALDAAWMQTEIERLEHSIEQDPALAIGTAKELVESCCKSILTKRKVDFARGADIGDLTKLVTKELKLVPEGISDESKGADNIRLILRNLTSLTHNLAQLRGLYGSGHGRDGKHRGLQARHARLAVTSAVAFIDFICDTYRERDA